MNVVTTRLTAASAVQCRHHCPRPFLWHATCRSCIDHVPLTVASMNCVCFLVYFKQRDKDFIKLLPFSHSAFTHHSSFVASCRHLTLCPRKLSGFSSIHCKLFCIFITFACFTTNNMKNANEQAPTSSHKYKQDVYLNDSQVSCALKI